MSPMFRPQHESRQARCGEASRLTRGRFDYGSRVLAGTWSGRSARHRGRQAISQKRPILNGRTQMVSRAGGMRNFGRAWRTSWLVLVMLSSTVRALAAVDVLERGLNKYRTGANAAETTLKPANVAA